MRTDLRARPAAVEYDVPVGDVVVTNRMRSLHVGTVDALAESMGRLGLIQAIVIDSDGVLVCGWHRLEAARKLGWPSIRVRIINDTNLDKALAAIDENLCMHDTIRQIVTIRDRKAARPAAFLSRG